MVCCSTRVIFCEALEISCEETCSEEESESYSAVWKDAPVEANLPRSTLHNCKGATFVRGERYSTLTGSGTSLVQRSTFLEEMGTRPIELSNDRLDRCFPLELTADVDLGLTRSPWCDTFRTQRTFLLLHLTHVMSLSLRNTHFCFIRWHSVHALIILSRFILMMMVLKPGVVD